MGGKHKGQAQRTKNNTKASTSGRSAELLSTNIKILPDFSNVVQDDFPGVTTSKLSVNDNESALNTDIQIAIKKMGKKDSTTKLKALQEFSCLVEKTDQSEVIPVLPIWSKIYPTLSMDTEHRVREAAQMSHGVVVTKCGRSLAPYLKQLAPFWLMSQYDTFAPAATQAQSSLQKVFPANKLPDVISFCRLELLSAISKNILIHSPSTITGAKSCTPEEAEAIYQRIIIASLQGFSLIIKHLPEDHTTWFCEELESILSNNKFWKLAAHKNPQIRSAWYIAIGCLCEMQSDWFGKKYSSKTLHILVKNLNEEDSTVAPNIWDCLLMLLAIKEIWNNNSVIDKVITDQLCSVVSQGGHGSGTRLAPILLPLLAHLPNSLRSLEFYKQFFDDIIKGMDQRSILSSKIEGTAWVSGLSECLRFVSKETDGGFAVQLVPAVVRSWLHKVIRLYKLQNSHHLFKQSVSSLALLAQFWTKQSLSDATLHYSQLVRSFWQNLRFIFTAEMDNLEMSNEAIKLTTDVHIALISDLRSNMANDKKCVKVKFSEEPKEEPNPKTSTSIPSHAQLDKVNDLYDKDHLLFVCEVASAYLKFAIKENVAAPILEPLCCIVSEFDKMDVFVAMYRSTFPQTDAVQLIKLYTDLWHKWLTGDSMRCQSVIDLIFVYFKYLDANDQADVFEGFSQCTPSVVEMCIAKCLCHPFSGKTLVKEWLNSNIVSETLVFTCKQLIKEGDRKKATLLKMCFVEDNNGKILIGDKSSAAIINTISSALPTISSNNLDMCASFASQLASVSIKDPQIRSNLILSMIKLISSVKAGRECISKDTWWAVNIAWQDAIQSSVWNESETEELIRGAEKIIKQSLQNGSSGGIDFDQIDVITEIAADLIISLISTTQPEKREHSLHGHFENITGINCTDSKKDWLGLYYQSIVFDIMRDHLNVPFADNDGTVELALKNSGNVFSEDLDGDVFKKQLVHCLYIAKLIHTIVLHCDHKSKTFDDDECYEPDKLSWISSVDMIGTMQKYIMLSLHNIMVLESLLSTHQTWQYFGIISSIYPKLQMLQIDIISIIKNNDEHKTSALQYLQNKADKEGLYWSKALFYYCKCIDKPLYSKHTKIENDDYNLPNADYQKSIFETVAPKSLDTFESVGFFHNLQAAANIDRENTDPFTIVTISGIVAVRCVLLSLTNAKEDNTMSEKDIDECFSGTFGCLTVIVNKYYKYKSIMLYERNISDADWCSVQTNVSILRYLANAVKYYGWHLNSMQWDFVTISLTLVLKSLSISKSKWKSLKWSSLCCAVFDLCREVRTFVYSIPSCCLKSAPSKTVANLPSEWKDIFEPDITENFLDIIQHIFGEYMKITDLKVITKEAYVISQIGRSIDENTFKFGNRIASLDNIVDSCLQVLSSTRHHSLKYTAYNLMKVAVEPLVTRDNNELNSLSEGCEEGTSLPKIALHKMESSLTRIQELLEVILTSFKLCEDSCAFEPFTDSYSIALSYLLIWNIINKITSMASGDLKHQYSEFLKSGKYTEHLCSNLFKMLPSEVIHRKETCPVDPQLLAKFTNSMNINYDELITSSLISTYACSVLAESMSGIGASSIRDWLILQDCERIIDAIVSAYISPYLNSNSLLDVQQRASELNDVQIRIHWTTNEITAVHAVEGKDFDLNIKLAPNNPLTKPKVSCTGVAASHTNWLTLFLSYQHGSLWEAVQMWAGSLQKKIEGSAVCYICYCRLQPTTGQLTKFVCYTCKNKFHTTCLYKWFRQSSKNTCPLCRKHF